MIGMRSPGSNVARQQAMWPPGNREAAKPALATNTFPATRALLLPGLLRAVATTMAVTVSKPDMPLPGLLLALLLALLLVLPLVLPLGNNRLLLVDSRAMDTVLTEVATPILLAWQLLPLPPECPLCIMVPEARRLLLPQAISPHLHLPAISPRPLPPLH
jgi:hypothetical protein